MHGVRTSTLRRHHHAHLVSIEEYDRQGRLIRKEEYTDKCALSGKKLVVFSPRGNRCETELTPRTKYVTGYDPSGRMIFRKSYSRRGRNMFTLTQLETHGYDQHGREHAWREETWVDGRPVDRESGERQLDERGLVTHVTMRKGPQGATGNITSDKTFTYDTRKRITSYRGDDMHGLLTTASWSYGPVGLIEHRVRHVWHRHTRLVIYRYNPVGRLLVREEHAWCYTVMAADGKPSWVESQEDSTPYDTVAAQHDPPLFLSTRYSYDNKGRLTRVANFDGKDAPCYVEQDIDNDGHDHRWTMAYSYLDYHYDDKGKPHFAAFTADGKPVLVFADPNMQMCFFAPSPSNYSLVCTRIIDHVYTHRPFTDRHGNWIRGYGQVRKISYY